MSNVFDVIVVGFGYAGGIAAIEAHDAGARVLLVEKRADPGGISVCSAGGVRYAKDAKDALAYLERTNAGTTPVPVLDVLAHGMLEMPSYINGLAAAVGAKSVARPATGNYPFEGHETFGFVNVEEVPNFDAATEFPSVRGSIAGARLFKVVLDNVRKRSGITVRFSSPVETLMKDDEKIVGVKIAGQVIRAKRAVILTTGGFEGSPEIQKQFWPMQPVLSAAIRTNTGDGMRMAQAAGASLWHMWHYHGSYGFKHPDPDYPFGVRLKRLPDWLPGVPFRDDVTMTWIMLDRSGKRFMNEYEPYMQDTGHRSLEPMDMNTQAYHALPALLIADAEGMKHYALSAPTWHDDAVAAKFKQVDTRAMDEQILQKFDSIANLAAAFSLDRTVVATSLAEWNRLVTTGGADPLGRRAAGRAPIVTPPFYAAQVWPIVSNTQGGPAHDERQRVLDAFGRPIPGLFEAGEIGSVFGHIYMSGGNLAECFVGGRIAGREAAAMQEGAMA